MLLFKIFILIEIERVFLLVVNLIDFVLSPVELNSSLIDILHNLKPRPSFQQTFYH